MKRLLTIVVAAAALVGCSNNNLTIKGTLANYDKEVVYVHIGGSFSEEPLIVEAKVVGGEFTAKANIAPQPASAVLLDCEQPDYSQGQPKMIGLVVEPGELAINADWESGRINTATGSEHMTVAIELLKATKPLEEEAMKLQQNRTPENEAKLMDIVAQYEKAQNELFAKYPHSYSAVSYFGAYASQKTTDELEAYYNALPEDIKAWKEAQEIKEVVAVRRALEPGKPAPIIGGTDINGNPFSLDQLKGNYILIDFWASWCRPCRASNPHVKALYEKYKDHGFKVLYVADNDSNPDEWRKAVEQDGLQEFHHILRGLKHTPSGGFDTSNDQSEKYDIHFLPTKYLIDSDFNIIGKVDDKSLEEELKKAFGF